MSRQFFRRYLSVFFRKSGRKGNRRQLLPAILLGFGMAALLISGFNAQVRPQLAALAETQVRNRITHIAENSVSVALEAQQLSYGDLISFQANDGSVSTLSTNTAQLNRLRSDIMRDIVTQVESLDRDDIGIPLGAISGLDLLAAFGPNLPVQVLSVASAEVIYQNEFSSAGINQTMHRIMLYITVTARLLFPGGIVETCVTTPVCVAETILVGNVPQTYLSMNQ